MRKEINEMNILPKKFIAYLIDKGIPRCANNQDLRTIWHAF